MKSGDTHRAQSLAPSDENVNLLCREIDGMDFESAVKPGDQAQGQIAGLSFFGVVLFISGVDGVSVQYFPKRRRGAFAVGRKNAACRSHGTHLGDSDVAQR